MTRSVARLAITRLAVAIGVFGALGALGALGAHAKDEEGAADKPAAQRAFVAPHADTRERAMALDIRVRALLGATLAELGDPDAVPEDAEAEADEALTADLHAFAARLRLATGLLRKREGSNDVACAYLRLAQTLEADVEAAQSPSAHERLLALGAAHDTLVDAALIAYDIDGPERDSAPRPICFGKPLNRA